MEAGSSKRWNADLYDDKISFVSKYGEDVLKLLNPQQGETILDLGCGTGDLSKKIHDAGALTVGMDASFNMIAKAKEKYPELRFLAADAETFRTAETYDAVFSNAALHWMKRPERVLQTISLLLRPGGRFAAEFGGKGNVQSIIDAIAEVLSEYGIDAQSRNPWYFPSIGEYTGLLERCGFHVTYAVHFKRPTPLEDGELGLTHWLDSFADAFFTGLSAAEKETAYDHIIGKLRPSLFHEGRWEADYQRIRILAFKR